MNDAERAKQHQESPGRYRVTVHEHLWIPMPDGVRLAARFWLPETAPDRPVPAILEYIPYRKADLVRARDERNHPYFASHGYACLRVDMRGSGDSEGRMDDMYSADELADARHVIKWIAAQPWCDGHVGMFGTSWGGTASLQANIDAPEPLKAVIAVCASHDRYEDDIHHMGGCLLTDTFEWGATLPAILGAPPTANVGPQWMDLWQERLDGLSFPVEAWVREEARGEYWRHGSVIHCADQLSRPILAVGGWSDRYSNSVMSLVSARPDLVWGVVGPWGHHYPDHGHPGPAIGFQQLALNWWDHWLKPGRQDGPDWPRLRVWLREFDPPADTIGIRHGRWIESGPPSTCTRSQILDLGTYAFACAMTRDGDGWVIPADLRVGRAAGDTGYFGRHGGLPLDQRDDDEISLVFETPPLDEDLVLYGAALARLDIDTELPSRQVSLRLNDVAADGTSSRVVQCARNLALDDKMDAPERPLAPGKRHVEIPFPTIAYRFRKGHRVRLAIADSYWPIIWPSAESGDLRVVGGELALPLFRGSPDNLGQALAPALDLPAVKTHQVLAQAPLHHFYKETPDGELVCGWDQPYTEVRYHETDTCFGYETRAEHVIKRDAPISACSTFKHRAVYRRPDGVANLHCRLTASCDAQTFFLSGTLEAQWNGEMLIAREWKKSIPRRHG